MTYMRLSPHLGTGAFAKRFPGHYRGLHARERWMQYFQTPCLRSKCSWQSDPSGGFWDHFRTINNYCETYSSSTGDNWLCAWADDAVKLLQTSNLTRMFLDAVRSYPLKIFRKGAVSPGSRDTLMFWPMNANSSRTIKLRTLNLASIFAGKKLKWAIDLSHVNDCHSHAISVYTAAVAVVPIPRYYQTASISCHITTVQ